MRQTLKSSATTPKAVCNVDGFEFSVEQKQGTLLTTKTEEGGEVQPVSENSYYEIKIRPNGDNPKFPAAENPSTHYYTVGLDGIGSGFHGDIVFAPAGSQFKKFELVQEFNDGRNAVGQRTPFLNTVTLRAHFRDAEGNLASIGLGAWVQRSDLENPDRKAALRNPAMLI